MRLEQHLRPALPIKAGVGRYHIREGVQLVFPHANAMTDARQGVIETSSRAPERIPVAHDIL